MNSDLLKIFEKASLCRNFENYVYDKIADKTIKFPVYLSAGQEFISATIAYYCEINNIEPNIFIQHRGHSVYLSFGADIAKLIDELLGLKSGCSFGMGGSASIQSVEKNIYGHDGLMGSNVPIAVGHCYETKHPTIVFVGDAAAEEDYCLAAYGWAATKKLPILFVVEDNNLSILTEKKVRRNWEISDVARSMNLRSMNLSDDPLEILQNLNNCFDYPTLLNINTTRLYWHAGAGKDGDNFDRFNLMLSQFGDTCKQLNEKNKNLVEKLWLKQLEKL